MAATEAVQVASLATSLSESFIQVPPSAVPAMLDCVLTTTGLSPLSLFSSLVADFPNLTNLVDNHEGNKMDHGRRNYIISLVAAMCHLLGKLPDNREAFALFLWKTFIPLMKIARAYDYEMLNKVVESFFDVVINTNTWDVLESDMVPFLLRSIKLSSGIFQREPDVIRWACFTDSNEIDNVANHLKFDEDCIPLSRSFPLPLSCHLLSLVVEASLQCLQEPSLNEPMLVKKSCYAEKLLASLLWDLCNLTELLLLQSSEHRTSAVSFLLPIIFKTFSSYPCMTISFGGKICKLFRNDILKRIWKCCKTLFSLGYLERRDAYNILSLYVSSFSYEGFGNDNQESEQEKFDLRTEKVFWNEIKRGLVDDESLVRKQSLHILRKVLCLGVSIQCGSGSSERKAKGSNSASGGIRKRDLWADKEAKSLGVGKLYGRIEGGLTSKQKWEAFLLLYEMLEEYGTHLVEAAWSNQVALLLQSSFLDDCFENDSHQNRTEASGGTPEVFNWLSVLWERGFCHDNPQVRCMIMQSFLDIEWKKYGSCAKSIPESFILGPFLEGLNDPVHHKNFGMKGLYSSVTIQGAARFLHVYASFLNLRQRMAFLIRLAHIAKKQTFGRAGLMGLAECIASSTSGFSLHHSRKTEQLEDGSFDKINAEAFMKQFCQNRIAFLDLLRFVIESSNQHFNPNYRLKVCCKILEAASSVMHACDVPLVTLLHFISAIPRKFTNCIGSLCKLMQEWLSRCNKNICGKSSSNEACLLKSLQEFPEGFITEQYSVGAFDDEDLDVWESQAKRWARVLILVIKEEQHLAPVLMFIYCHGVKISKHFSQLELVAVKFVVLISSFVHEIQKIKEHTAGSSVEVDSTVGFCATAEIIAGAPIIEKFANVFLSILDELISFADLSCSIFWSDNCIEDGALPGSVRGKLGGPSQRRLSSYATTSVLKAVTSVKSMASISIWCAEFASNVQLNAVVVFFWKFFGKTISISPCTSETAAEMHLAAYESLVPVLKAFASLWSSQALATSENDKTLLSAVEGKFWFDNFIHSFLLNINDLLAAGVLARTRRAVLLNWKWLCVESILSIMYNDLHSRVLTDDSSSIFSGDAVRSIFNDIVESLENAGEGSVLPMLRSVRLALDLLASEELGHSLHSWNADTQVMWCLVNSCWTLHVSCNKRRVAPIAALLSSVLRSCVFGDESMHVINDVPGPLKWFVEKLLEEGLRSPRTIRLLALHLTGLLLSYPRMIKYYIKELKSLTLYGSVAFDEDFAAELSDNSDGRAEVSLLAKSPDPELTEVFINTELYARVSVAVLFYKLADVVATPSQNQDCEAALESGKLLLLDLLDSVVHDKDLAKELYKKYSGIHRRKIRAWQMICVLSQFVDGDIVSRVTECIHVSLYRGNLPAVRQYLETFAINIYLRFPSLVKEQLVPILRDYDMRPQALSSYVFIAANIILHAPGNSQVQHIDELLPPIIPLLTSHHHSLRGFTQLLVHHILSKLLDPGVSQTMCIEKRSFEDLKSYLARNPDCARLRSSMEGYLDAYDPRAAVTPAGIFVNRVEEMEFECVPTSLMDQVLSFLNDAREDLRYSMAKDVVTMQNERLKIPVTSNCTEDLSTSENGKLLQHSGDTTLDFQKKVTLSKHEKQDGSSSFLGNKEIYERLLEIEKEDELVNQLLRSRTIAVEKLGAGRQSFILVASLLDRIPNLAGLARTCEVFKASGLAVADKSIIQDKQFQLISVTAEKWVPIVEVPVTSVKKFLEKKKREGFSILGLEQTTNSVPLDQFAFPTKMVLVLGREKEGIPVDIIHILDACIEIPQLGVVRSLNVHVSGAIALWEYTRQQRAQ